VSVQLIETMRWAGGIRLLGYHLDRLARSAGALGFRYGSGSVRLVIDAATSGLDPARVYRVRLLLSADGQAVCTSTPLDPPFAGPIPVCIARSVVVDPSDPFIAHKTTRREVYDLAWDEAQAAGCGEAILLDVQGRVAEGSRSNVFVRLDGQLFTPPAAQVLLPGVYRRYLMKKHPGIVERELTPADLRRADAVYLSNAVWGLRDSRLASSD
jgi:para-aminobenzoate synthetase/4-amino-4-deoxychorismate lyase